MPHPVQDFIVRRFPLVSAVWTLSTFAWALVLVVDAGLGIGAVAAGVAMQLVVLAGAHALLARTATPPRLVAAGATVLLGWTLVGFFAAIEGPRDVLGVMLLTLYVTPAFAFAWGLRLELWLVTLTALPALALGPAFAPTGRSAELFTAMIFGTLVSIAVAEGMARSLQQARRLQMAEGERTRELAVSRDAYRDLAENVRDLVWAVDRAGNWTYVNVAVERFFGVPRDALLGRSSRAMLLDPPDPATIEAHMARLAAGENLPPIRVRCQTAHGTRWIEGLPSGIFDAAGQMIGVRGISRDVTEQFAMEASLRESEAKFRTLAEAMPAAVFIVQGTALRYVNRAAVAMTGYSEAEQLGMHFWEILHPEDRELVRARGMARQRGVSLPRSFEYRLLTKTGEERFVSFTASNIEYAGAPAFLGTAIDVSERKQAEQALRRSLAVLERREDELRRLAQHQAAIREEERKRVGLDLHDGVCQELIGIGCLVASVRQRLGTLDASMGTDLDRAVGYVNELVEHLRLMARELRPMLLHDLGLEGSLRSLAAGMATPARPVVSSFATPVPRLLDDVEVAVYRIAQEALANAVRHAGAKSIALTLAVEGTRLHLEVRDDGCGFDAAVRRGDRLGLVSMQERALALGGRLEVGSRPDGGTVVRLDCPLALRGAPASAA